MTNTYFADISSWQAPVNSTYPYPVLSFRVDWGGGIDDNAAHNWAFARDTARIKVGIGYVVFKPGQAHAIFDRVKGFFGARAPAKLVIMLDMESGGDFAGGGNHSTEANELAELFAIWLGNRARVIGYANHYDWQSCWPSAPSWLKRVTAAYSTQDPGTFGWQYYGGVAANPSPSGYPRSCKPFGSNVDMNVIHQPIATIVAELGLTPASKEFTVDAASKKEIQAMLDAQTNRILGNVGHYVWAFTARIWNKSKPQAWSILGNIHQVTNADHGTDLADLAVDKADSATDKMDLAVDKADAAQDKK